MIRCSLIAAALVLSFSPARAEQPGLPAGMKLLRDLDYAGTGNAGQMLDLVVPSEKPDKPLPLVVFIHGGGWESGNKADGKVILPLLKDGKYAGATIAYRLSQEAIWPAQISDCKAALRWLRAHAADYGYDPDRIALFGISAGGHLVSLLGTSQDVTTLDGDTGSETAKPVTIRCVMNFCGPADFLTFGNRGSEISPQDRKGPIAKLFGGPLQEHLEAGKAASPVTWINAGDPPFLHIHGTKDPLVPYSQVQEFDAALEKAGVSSTVLTGEGAGHVFFSPDLFAKMQIFLDHHLLGESADVSEGPVAVK